VLVWLITAAWRRRSAARALAAATAAVVFSDYTPLPWPGHPADPARMVASDLYVLFGLAVLAAVGVALARSQRYRRALTRAISLSMSEDSAGLGDWTFSSWLSIM
jgi:hypothetical protein